jgi:hypothetical protein
MVCQGGSEDREMQVPYRVVMLLLRDLASQVACCSKCAAWCTCQVANAQNLFCRTPHTYVWPACAWLSFGFHIAYPAEQKSLFYQSQKWSTLVTLVKLVTTHAGLAVGGEFGGCIVYLYEIAPKHRKGLLSSFGQMSIVSAQHGGSCCCAAYTVGVHSAAPPLLVSSCVRIHAHASGSAALLC